jgi:hypothetical protein
MSWVRLSLQVSALSDSLFRGPHRPLISLHLRLAMHSVITCSALRLLRLCQIFVQSTTASARYYSISKGKRHGFHADAQLNIDDGLA